MSYLRASKLSDYELCEPKCAMAHVDPGIVEMPENESLGAMPPYRRLIDWIETETAGLTPDQLDFHDTSPDNEWM